MGIVDDYYGGYETLAMFTNMDTGDVDFESAYNFTNFNDGFCFPNIDSDEFEDEAEKELFYSVARGMTQGPGSTSRGGGSSRGAGRRHGGGGRGAIGRSTHPRGEPVPGWEPTGQRTADGRQVFGGVCSSCGEQCTVPFRPLQGRPPPCCRACHGAGGAHAQQQQQQQQHGGGAAASAGAAHSSQAQQV